MTGKNVEYGLLDTQDSVPAKPRQAPRSSPLMDAVTSIEADPKLHGKAHMVARYESKTACGAAANVLRQRFGRSSAVRGYEFSTRRHTVKDENGETQDRHALWVTYRPDAIVPGELEKHQAAEEARIQRLYDLRAKKDAEKAAATNGSEAHAKGSGAKAKATSGAKS